MYNGYVIVLSVPTCLQAIPWTASNPTIPLSRSQARSRPSSPSLFPRGRRRHPRHFAEACALVCSMPHCEGAPTRLVEWLQQINKAVAGEHRPPPVSALPKSRCVTRSFRDAAERLRTGARGSCPSLLSPLRDPPQRACPCFQSIALGSLVEFDHCEVQRAALELHPCPVLHPSTNGQIEGHMPLPLYHALHQYLGPFHKSTDESFCVASIGRAVRPAIISPKGPRPIREDRLPMEIAVRWHL